MAARLDPARIRQWVARLRPGAVIKLYSALAGKNKRHGLISATADRSVAFFINTRPADFIRARPDLLKRQVLMPLASHRFMAYDSHIACHDTVRIPTMAYLVAGLDDDSIQLLGHVHRSLFPAIINSARGSPNISERDLVLIVSGFTV